MFMNPTAGRELIALERDCEATEVPSGAKVTLSKGTKLRIMQVAGGDFSIMTVMGRMARIEGRDADALGKERPKDLAADVATEGGTLDDDKIRRVLSTIYDPEIPVNIMDLGLVYDLAIDPPGGAPAPPAAADAVPAGPAQTGALSAPTAPVPAAAAASPRPGSLVLITMTLTAPACGMGPVLIEDVKRRVGKIPGVGEVKVELVFDPPWGPERMSEAARLQLGL